MVSLEVQLDSSNSSRSDLSKNSLEGHEIGTNYTEGKRNILSVSEDVDVQMHLCCVEGLSDQYECMWLSSGNTSTSFLSSDDLQSLDVLDIDFCDALLYDQSTISPVQNVGNRSTIFDGSTIDPIEASPVLTRVQDGAGEDMNEDGNSVEDSSKMSSECVESVHMRSYCDDLSSNSNHSWPSLSKHDEPSSEDNDFDRTDVWVSLLDLDNEESEWDRDGFDALDPDFPSPSYRILQNLRIGTSKLSFCPSSKQSLDVQASLGSASSIFDLSPKFALHVESPPKNSGADEPLFWPFEWKSYWRPEFEGNYLGISPRAGILRIKRPRGPHAPKPIRVGLHNRNGPSPHTDNNIQQGHRGRILITSRSARPTLSDRKTRDLNNRVSHNGKAPSRLSRSTTSSSDKSASNHSKKGGKGRDQLHSGKKKRGRDQKSSPVQYLLEFEAGEFQIYLGGEIPIEALVGLDEFDGHEGVGKLMRAS